MTQPITTTVKGREFSCSAAAILVWVVNDNGEILFLKHPERRGWEVINGGLDAGETLIDAAQRELAEEAGPHIKVRPLGLLHACTFNYDAAVQYMLSISYLMAYEGGDVVPGDDMTGSQVLWVKPEDALADPDFHLIVPPQYDWMMARAVELHALWKDRPTPTLQFELDFTGKYSKYAKPNSLS